MSKKPNSNPKLFAFITILTLCLLVLMPVGAALAVEPPAIAAKAAMLINASDGQVLYSLNPDESMPMASTTKMMTALLIIENVPDLNAKVTCSKRCAEVGESSIFLKEGEVLTVKEMLTGMLVQSGNDAATALAEFEAGSVEAFVEKMNRRSADLGLARSHFANPHGLDDPLHFTSASDFVRLGAEVMKHGVIRDIVKSAEASIPWTGQPFARTLINHNHLLEQYPFINGIKTGYTDAAGQCIVISGNDNGVHLILSYMGGPSLSQRDQDVVNLLKFGFDSYQSTKVIVAGQEYANISLPYYPDRQLSLVSNEDLTRQIYNKSKVEHRLVLPDKVELPIRKGDQIGLVEAYIGDNMLGSIYLLAAEDVERPGMVDRFVYYARSFYQFLAAAVNG